MKDFPRDSDGMGRVGKAETAKVTVFSKSQARNSGLFSGRMVRSRPNEVPSMRVELPLNLSVFALKIEHIVRCK